MGENEEKMSVQKNIIFACYYTARMYTLVY